MRTYNNGNLSVPRTLEAGVGGLWGPGDRVGNLGTLGKERRLSGTLCFHRKGPADR